MNRVKLITVVGLLAAPATPQLATAPASLDPEAVFGYPRGAIEADVRELPATGSLRRLNVCFESRLPSGYIRNDHVYARLLLPTGGSPVPCVIVLHCLRSKHGRFAFRLGERLAGQGIAALLVTLPYHMQRAPEGTRSGYLMITGNPPRTVRAFQQAVVDIRCAIDWLQGRPEIDPGRIGVTGISLGGVITLLASQVDKRVKVAVSIVGTGDVANIFLHSPITMRERHRARAAGWTDAQLAELFRPIDPITYSGHNPNCHLLMINGWHDMFLPRRDVQRTWVALGRPDIVWLNSGHHSALLTSGEVFQLATDYLRQHFGLARPRPVPTGLPSTTLRAGLVWDKCRGFQFGLALQGLSRDARSPLCTDLLISTKGLLAGASLRIGENVNLGLGVPVGRKIRGATPYLTIHANL